MLILTRRPSETVNIGPNVTVTVLGVKGNQVRLGTGRPLRRRFGAVSFLGDRAPGGGTPPPGRLLLGSSSRCARG